MDHDEQVLFCRNELGKARRDFPKDSNEVQVAENCYERALVAALDHGSPNVRGSDISLSDFTRVVLCCDKVNVTAMFHFHDQRIGRVQVFTRKEAIELGQRVTDAGLCEEFPIADISTSAIRTFGNRLKEYGENCR